MTAKEVSIALSWVPFDLAAAEVVLDRTRDVLLEAARGKPGLAELARRAQAVRSQVRSLALAIDAAAPNAKEIAR